MIERFRYLEFGLQGCSAEEYLGRPEPLAWALSALMRREHLSPAEHKVQCLKRIAAARLAGKRRFILGRTVDAYLVLRGQDQRQFEELRSCEENQEVVAMEMTLLQRAEAQALKKGLAQGLEKGLARGRDQGRREAEASLLLDLLERKFGPLTKAVRARATGADARELRRWGKRLLTAKRLEEVFAG